MTVAQRLGRSLPLGAAAGVLVPALFIVGELALGRRSIAKTLAELETLVSVVVACALYGALISVLALSVTLVLPRPRSALIQRSRPVMAGLYVGATIGWILDVSFVSGSYLLTTVSAAMGVAWGALSWGRVFGDRVGDSLPR